MSLFSVYKVIARPEQILSSVSQQNSKLPFGVESEEQENDGSASTEIEVPLSPALISEGIQKNWRVRLFSVFAIGLRANSAISQNLWTPDAIVM